MKNILVPTDFSSHAMAAFETAVSLSRRTGAQVYLYHVIEVPEVAEMHELMAWRESGGEGSMESADGMLRQLVMNEAYHDIRPVYSIDYGTPHKCISAKAAGEGFDLVVIGSHGMSRIDKIIFGSTTEKVIRNTLCPVLTINDTISCFQPSTIVFCAGIAAEQACGLETVKSISLLYNAVIHIVKVSTPEHFETTRQSRMAMKTFVETNKLAEYTLNHYNDRSVEEGLKHFSEDINADMLCMPTHGSSGIRHLFRKSVTGSVTGQIAIPVLTCRIPGT